MTTFEQVFLRLGKLILSSTVCAISDPVHLARCTRAAEEAQLEERAGLAGASAATSATTLSSLHDAKPLAAGLALQQLHPGDTADLVQVLAQVLQNQVQLLAAVLVLYNICTSYYAP